MNETDTQPADGATRARRTRKALDAHYDRWTVLNPKEESDDGTVLCECTCGTRRRVGRSRLITGRTRSCGCNRRDALRGTSWNTDGFAPDRGTVVIPGARFGRWTVRTEILPTHKRHTASCATDGCTLRNNRTVECECDCGKTGTVVVGHLLSGKSRSCGCLKADAGRALHDTR